MHRNGSISREAQERIRRGGRKRITEIKKTDLEKVRENPVKGRNSQRMCVCTLPKTLPEKKDWPNVAKVKEESERRNKQN